MQLTTSATTLFRIHTNSLVILNNNDAAASNNNETFFFNFAFVGLELAKLCSIGLLFVLNFFLHLISAHNRMAWFLSKHRVQEEFQIQLAFAVLLILILLMWTNLPRSIQLNNLIEQEICGC